MGIKSRLKRERKGLPKPEKKAVDYGKVLVLDVTKGNDLRKATRIFEKLVNKFNGSKYMRKSYSLTGGSYNERGANKLVSDLSNDEVKNFEDDFSTK